MKKDSFSHDQELMKILRGLESNEEEYPAELLAARRKLFIEELEKRMQLGRASASGESDQKMIEVFRSLKVFEPEYPPQMFVRRRAVYRRQLADIARVSVWTILRSALRNFPAGWIASYRSIPIRLMRTSALALGMAMFAFVAFALYGNVHPSHNSVLDQSALFTPVQGTSTPVWQAAIICKNGSDPPLCLAQEFDNSRDLSYAGNGNARPAVAKDTYPGNGQIHHASQLNDGLYGPGASWVSDSPNSWIKIDLGITTEINTVTFGRDRLGKLNDGDPGGFTIAVATADDVYADGNSSNDEYEYVEVYDSDRAGFDGDISGAETIVALFEIKKARYIKITFENARTAIDEVEAFVSPSSRMAIEPAKTSSSENSRPEESTLLPVNTPLPTDTATAVPIDTLPPTETVTPMPTDPPTPVQTATPIDTPTPIEPTAIPPSSTPIPVLTDDLIPTDSPVEPLPGDSLDPLGDGSESNKTRLLA